MPGRERRALRHMDQELSDDPVLSRLATLFARTEPGRGPAPEQLPAAAVARPGRVRLSAILGVVLAGLAGALVSVLLHNLLWTDLSLAAAVCAAATLAIDPQHHGRSRGWPLRVRPPRQAGHGQLDRRG